MNGWRSLVAQIVKTWVINIQNTAVFLGSRGHKVLHEGRYRRGKWTDWYREYECHPKQYKEPSSEKEICDLVARAGKVRVVGAGHSFNAGPLSDDLLLSLDRYDKVTVRDGANPAGWKMAEVQAGIRLRDLNEVLAKEGAALPVAGSTNAQSIGGLIATDLHGTGRDHGFLSECLKSLRIVDAAGRAATFGRGHPVFHAAIGGAGTCGVVIGADIAVHPTYNLAKAVRVVPREWAEKNLDALLEENTHLSFYYFGGLADPTKKHRSPGLDLVRMNKWNRTIDSPNPGRRIIKLVDELFDMLFSGHILGVARTLHFTDWLASAGIRLYGVAVNHRMSVYPAEESFARKLFFCHEEIEYGIPRKNFRACIEEVDALLRNHRFPAIIEIRFTPKTSQAMLGPGVGGPTAYLELAPSTSRPSDAVFREFEQIVLRHGGRPHLGKKLYVDGEQMERIYGSETMTEFRKARREQDPSGKFLNEFTERILGG